jgi:hypothetical protein
MASDQQFSTNLGLGALPEIDQRKNPDIYNDLLRIRNALKTLQFSLDQYTGAISEDSAYWKNIQSQNSVRTQNISKVYAVSSDTIAVGQIVELYNNAGVLTARLSNVGTPRYARAFCSTLGGATPGAVSEFSLLGVNQFFSGLTPGAIYYLSGTPGAIQAGATAQRVGFALTAQNLFFNPTLI